MQQRGSNFLKKKFKNTIKKVNYIYKKLEEYAEKEYNYGQDRGHVDYFLNYINITATSTEFREGLSPTCISTSDGFYTGIVANKESSPFIPTVKGYDARLCNFSRTRSGTNSQVASPYANNFAFYKKVNVIAESGIQITMTTRLIDILGLTAEDVFDDFGAPILFDNSSIKVRHPYHKSPTLRKPPFNARIVATIPSVGDIYSSNISPTVIFNKYQKHSSTIKRNSRPTGARNIIGTIIDYNKPILNNLYPAKVEYFSCYDPHIENIDDYTYAYGSFTCTNSRQGWINKENRIWDNNYMLYPVKPYVRYIESPY